MDAFVPEDFFPQLDQRSPEERARDEAELLRKRFDFFARVNNAGGKKCPA